MSNGAFKIGLVQLAVGPDKESTVAAHEDAIREAARQGAQVICLQELFDAPYFCKVTDAERFNLAEPMPGPTTERMQRLAKELEVVIIVPMFEKRGPGVYHNSAAVVDADGEMLGVYRKMHIPDDPMYYEKYYFTPGEIYQPSHVVSRSPASLKSARTGSSSDRIRAARAAWSASWAARRARYAASCSRSAISASALRQPGVSLFIG